MKFILCFWFILCSVLLSSNGYSKFKICFLLYKWYDLCELQIGRQYSIGILFIPFRKEQ